MGRTSHYVTGFMCVCWEPSLRIATGCVRVPRERLPRRADGLWRCCLVFGVARDGVEDLGVPATVKTGLFQQGTPRASLTAGRGAKERLVNQSHQACTSCRCRKGPLEGDAGKHSQLQRRFMAVFQKGTGSTCFIEEVARRKRRSFSRDISPHEVMQQQQNCL